MIHYHGLPITPAVAAFKAINGGHGFVSFAYPEQISIAIDVCQSFAIDNGAFSAWKAGKPITDWTKFYEFAEYCRRIPSCDFAVIPDVIDGTEVDNDALLDECPLPVWFGAPVWHLHESFDRLERLAVEYPRICFGSSGDYSSVGSQQWWLRISQAMKVICDNEGRPCTKLHGLRMLNPAIFTKLPFASADSTNIARNVGIDQHWKGTYNPPNKETRAAIIRSRIEAHQSPPVWNFEQYHEQGLLL